MVEADTPKGHNVDGVASLRALEARHGALPATLTAISPSGSLHGGRANWIAAADLHNSFAGFRTNTTEQHTTRRSSLRCTEIVRDATGHVAPYAATRCGACRAGGSAEAQACTLPGSSNAKLLCQPGVGDFQQSVQRHGGVEPEGLIDPQLSLASSE
jgi:hypothetical protein